MTVRFNWNTFSFKFNVLLVHFIAIGGSVMHQLAIALKKKGYAVTGSDDEIFEPAASNLRAEGLLPPAIGWFPDKITPKIDAVILGMHARNDNPELEKARSLGLKIYSFPEYIYEESRDKTRIVVGGSHGKTTTTAMIMHILRKLNKQFDYLVGAKLEGFSESVQITNAPIIVCEGDEYPASVIEKKPKFHFLFPHIAIITGIAWDHINVFPTFDIYLEQFNIFINKIQPNGSLIYNASDPVLKELVQKHPSSVKKIPYTLPAHRIINGQTEITIDGISTTITVFGDHNLLNLHAAYLALLQLGIGAKDFLPAIADFSGASKRLELLAANKDVRIYRDFAHAPSKVKATMAAVKQQYPQQRLVAVLELHTYSSLNEAFLHQYAGSLDEADEAAVFYSAHALEIKKMPPLSSAGVVQGFARKGLQVFTEKQQLLNWLAQQSYENLTLLFMSSGNYDGVDVPSLAKDIISRT